MKHIDKKTVHVKATRAQLVAAANAGQALYDAVDSATYDTMSGSVASIHGALKAYDKAIKACVQTVK